MYWKKHHRIKANAHNYSYKKMRHLRPEMCEKCNKLPARHAHHPDYTKPKKIIWLCIKCHSKEHKKRKIA
jgi:hypothetical protein